MNILIQQLSRPTGLGPSQVQVTDTDYDYGDTPEGIRLGWHRAFSFLPMWGRIYIRPDGRGGVVIQYRYS
jgi:hypothetical protein